LHEHRDKNISIISHNSEEIKYVENTDAIPEAVAVTTNLPPKADSYLNAIAFRDVANNLFDDFEKTKLEWRKYAPIQEIAGKINKADNYFAPSNPKKPVQPITLDRPKENITTLNQEQQLLPETNTQLEFDPIGLKKGTYFTRPRQQQEAGQGKMDYFDNKTGKLLKTMEFGGNITTESEWELVNEDLPKAGNGLSLVKTLTPIGNKVIPRNPSLYKDAINNVDKIEHNINDRYRVQADDFTDKNYPTDYDEDSGHNDYVDALRHSATAMYTTSGQGNFLAPLKVPYTNVMGLAHELKGLGSYVSNPDKLTWQGAKQQLRETGSDLYNNFVGSMIGGLPINIENKEKILKFAKDKNILSDLSKKQNGGKLPKRRLNLNKSSDWEIVD